MLKKRLQAHAIFLVGRIEKFINLPNVTSNKPLNINFK